MPLQISNCKLAIIKTMDFLKELKTQCEDLRLEYFHSAKWKPAIRLLLWSFGYIVSFFKNLGRKYESWCVIRDRYGVDITWKYSEILENMRVPSLETGHFLRFDIEKALKKNPKTKRIGLVIYNGIGDYFLCTAFIRHLANTYPYLAFDAYIPSFKKNLAEMTSVNPCFERTVLFESSLEHQKSVPDLSAAYSLAGKDTLVLPLYYDFRPSVHSRYMSLCHNFGTRPENNVPIPFIPLDYDLSSNGKAILSEIEEKLRKMPENKGIVWLQLTSASAKYIYPYSEKLISLFCDNGWLVICVDKNDFKGDFSVNLNTGINDSIKMLSLLNKKYTFYCVGIHSCFGPISSGLEIPCLLVQPYWDSKLKSVWHDNEFVVFNKKYPQIPDDRQFVIRESEKNPPFNISFSPEQVYSCFEKIRKRR